MNPSTLTPAQKYNWWTPSDKKGSISARQQIATIMSQGTLPEVMAVFRGYPIADLSESYSRIKKDTYALTSRRKACLEVLLEEKKKGTI